MKHMWNTLYRLDQAKLTYGQLLQPLSHGSIVKHIWNTLYRLGQAKLTCGQLL
jgi:hypothetical protein